MSKSILKTFFTYIINDIIENKKSHIFLLIFLAVVFCSFKFILAHDDLMYYYGVVILYSDFYYRFIYENRIFYPLIVYIINSLYLSPKIILLFGFILFYINNFILIKLFFPKITKISYIFLSLLLAVNPLNFYTIRWSTTFFGIQLAIFVLFFSYYLFTQTNLKLYLKLFISSLAIWFSLSLMPVIFYIYITVLFLSVFWKFLLSNELNLKKIIKDNYLHISYILLGIAIFYIVDKLLLFYFHGTHNYSGRGEYYPVDSFNLLFFRINNTFLVLKQVLPIHFYSIIILNVLFLSYNIYTKKTYILPITFFVFICVLLFIPFTTDILLDVGGTLVRFNSLHYIMAVLFMLAINIFNKYFVKVILFVLSIYILMSVGLIDRYSKILADQFRINTSIYDNIQLESTKFDVNGNTKIYIYGRLPSYLFGLTEKRDIALLRIFGYYPDIGDWSKFYYQLPFLLKHIGYSNVEHLFNDNIDKELRNIIDDKTLKGIIYPKEGSIFEYKGNIYVIFSKDNN